MANTYTQLYTQIIFSTLGREPVLKSEFRNDLYKYIGGILLGKKQKPLKIGGYTDHLHIFTSVSSDITISDLVKVVKQSSNSFLREKGLIKTNFHWQIGFSAFSYSRSQIPKVIKYIEEQAIHHQKKTFEEEYLEFLDKYEINYDKKYVFD